MVQHIEIVDISKDSGNIQLIFSLSLMLFHFVSILQESNLGNCGSTGADSNWFTTVRQTAVCNYKLSLRKWTLCPYIWSSTWFLQAVLILNAGSKGISIALNNILTAKSGESHTLF